VLVLVIKKAPGQAIFSGTLTQSFEIGDFCFAQLKKTHAFAHSIALVALHIHLAFVAWHIP